MRIEATSLRQLSPSLRYFVLSETLHCAIIKFGNVIVSRLSIKFAFTLYCAIIKFGNVIVSRLSIKFAFTLYCAIIKFGNVIVSRLSLKICFYVALRHNQVRQCNSIATKIFFYVTSDIKTN